MQGLEALSGVEEAAWRFVSLAFVLSLSLCRGSWVSHHRRGEVSVCGPLALGSSRLCWIRCHAAPDAAAPFPAAVPQHAWPSWSSVPSPVRYCRVPEKRHVLPRLFPCVWARYRPVWRVYGEGPVCTGDCRFATSWPTVHP